MFGGAEFAGPENGGPKKNKDWKMQDLENDGQNHRAGKCILDSFVCVTFKAELAAGTVSENQ